MDIIAACILQIAWDKTGKLAHVMTPMPEWKENNVDRNNNPNTNMILPCSERSLAPGLANHPPADPLAS